MNRVELIPYNLLVLTLYNRRWVETYIAIYK